MVEQCCQTDGDYTLICKDSYGDGWHGGYITIEGVKYCENFDSGFMENHLISSSSGAQITGRPRYWSSYALLSIVFL